MLRRPTRIVLLAGVLIFIGAGSRAELPQASELAGGGGVSRFKVVMWYDRSRPFETFRYRAYDVGKGEYSTAVSDWMALMTRSYPGYTVSVRHVEVAEGDLAEKVTATVEEEKLALAKSIMVKYSEGVPRRNLEYGSGYRGLSWSPQSSAPYRDPSPFKNGIPSSFSPLGAAHPVPSPTYLYPNPMPYPRPHP